MKKLIILLKELEISPKKIKDLKQAYNSGNKLAVRVYLSWFSQYLRSLDSDEHIRELLSLIKERMNGIKFNE